MGKAKDRADKLKDSPYHSMFEQGLARAMEEAGVEFEYERETLIYVQPAQTRKYTPDFFLPNGIIIEAKGKWTIQDRKKMVTVMEQNPNLDIRMLFQYDNKLNKRAKERYSTWCEKRGIPYAIGTIPDDWLSDGATDPQEKCTPSPE